MLTHSRRGPQQEGPTADAELPVRRFTLKSLETVNFPSKAVLRIKQFPISLQQLGNVQRTGRGRPFVLPPFLKHNSHFFSTALLVLCYFASIFSIKRVCSLLGIMVPLPPISHISQHLLGSCYFLPKQWLHLQGLSSSNMES